MAVSFCLKYAEEFHGGDLTPREILAGDMMESVLVDSDSVDAACFIPTAPMLRNSRMETLKSTFLRALSFPMNKAGQLYALGVIEKCLPLVAEVEFCEFFGSNPF